MQVQELTSGGCSVGALFPLKCELVGTLSWSQRVVVPADVQWGRPWSPALTFQQLCWPLGHLNISSHSPRSSLLCTECPESQERQTSTRNPPGSEASETECWA